jgi:hypothetical protein
VSLLVYNGLRNPVEPSAYNGLRIPWTPSAYTDLSTVGPFGGADGPCRSWLVTADETASRAAAANSVAATRRLAGVLRPVTRRTRNELDGMGPPVNGE